MAIAVAAAERTTFRLESMDRKSVYGPFELGNGTRVVIEGRQYVLFVHPDNSVEFKSLETGRITGPHGFVKGRIVKMDDEFYTIIDVKKVKTARAPAAAEPDRAGGAVAGGSVPTGPPAVRPPVRAGPPVRSAAGVGHRERVAPRRVVQPRTEAAVEFDFVGSILYDADVRAVFSESETEFEEKRIAFLIRRDPVYFRFGPIWDGEWDEEIDGPELTFEDARIDEGTGWWIAVGLSRSFSVGDAWTATAYGEGSYVRKEYTLSYDAWDETTVVVPSTNGGPSTVETALTFGPRDTEFTLKEWLISGGGILSVALGNWSVYSGIEFLLLSDVSVDGVIQARGFPYVVDLDRSDRVTVWGGIDVTFGDSRLYAEASALEEQRITLGFARQF
jgi:hypothetical protein